MNFNIAYQLALGEVMRFGIETQPRKMKVKELLAYKMVIDPDDNIITIPGFETNLDYAKKELEWYLSGTSRIDFDPVIERTWKKFSDDGVHVNSAYGKYFFKPISKSGTVTQWDWIKSKLQEDPDSRQCVVNINQLDHKYYPTKDFPCTIACQVFIRQNRLYWITYMRSQDLFYGTRNDIYCFTELQKKLANELNVELGTYTHIMGNMHLYEKHWELAKKVLNE